MAAKEEYDAAARSTIETGLDIPSSALIPQMLDFYINGIGFQEVGVIDIDVSRLNLGPIQVRALRFGKTILKLKHDTSSDKPEVQRATSPSTTHYLSIRVSSVARTAARLKALTPSPTELIPPGEATTKQGGRVEFAFFLDPLGNQLELIQGNPWVGTENNDEQKVD